MPASTTTAPNMPAPVFRGYDQAALDRAYDQHVWAANADAVVARYGTASATVRSRLDRRADIAYGATPAEMLDVFPARQSAAPVQVFIHGGAWRLLSKDESCFAAETFVQAGACFVALNFANIPAVRLPDMVDQVRRGIAWVYRNIANFGGDPARLFISGHSSGGHLAAMALVTDWSEHGLPADVIKGGLCASGMYDLAPVMLSARRHYLGLSAAEIATLSPIRHLDRIACPVIVARGGPESPEFIRHADDFAAALGPRLDRMIVCQDHNHFEVVETLASPHTGLGQAVLRQMGLSPAG